MSVAPRVSVGESLRTTRGPHLRVAGWRGGFLAVALGLALGPGTLRCGRAADLDEILARQALRVGLPAGEAPPFLVVEPGGRLGGFEGELLQHAVARLNVRLDLVRSARTEAELVAQVRDGQVDLALGQLTDSLVAARSVRFTNPYLTLYELRLIDRLAAARAGGADPLLRSGTARFVTLATSPVAAGLSEEYGPARVGLAPTWVAAVAEVRAGRAAAVAGDDVTVQRWLQAQPEMALHLEARLRREHVLTLAMALHWRAEHLHAWLNLYLDKCRVDETLRNLRRKHLGEERMRWAK